MDLEPSPKKLLKNAQSVDDWLLSRSKYLQNYMVSTHQVYEAFQNVFIKKKKKKNQMHLGFYLHILNLSLKTPVTLNHCPELKSFCRNFLNKSL